MEEVIQPELKRLKQIYRFLAATALIAVMANVFLPASLAAAHYVCKTKAGHSATANTQEECGLPLEITNNDYYADTPCSIKLACGQTLINSLSDTPVILPVAQHLFSTLVPSVLSLQPSQNFSFKTLTVESAVPFPKAPLFLLNSVFIN